MSNIWNYKECLAYLLAKYEYHVLNKDLEYYLNVDLEKLKTLHGQEIFYSISNNILNFWSWRSHFDDLDLFEYTGIEQVCVNMLDFDKIFLYPFDSIIDRILSKIDLNKNIVFDFYGVESLSTPFISKLINKLFDLKGNKIKNYKFMNLCNDWKLKIEEVYRMLLDEEYRKHHMYNIYLDPK
jgi:hypothetical protein